MKELSAPQKQALLKLAERLQPGMSGEDIHQELYQVREQLDTEPRIVFEAIYIALLGKSRGPRAGWFISALDHDFVTKRFRQAGN